MLRQTILGVSLVCLLCVGCNNSNPLGRVPVSGEVSIGGQPLAAGSISFEPVDSGTMSGAVITDGHYEIPETKGLPPGKYLIRISAADESAPPEAMPGESNKVAKELIPAEYNRESDVTREVVAGEENIFDFEIPAAGA